MPLPPDFEKSLWEAADQLWTNSTLAPALHVYRALGFDDRPYPYDPPHLDADRYLELDLG